MVAKTTIADHQKLDVDTWFDISSKPIDQFGNFLC